MFLGREPGLIIVSRDTAEICSMLMGASFQLVYLTIGTCGLPVLAFSRPIIQECNQQGERVAQVSLVPVPQVGVSAVSDLAGSERRRACHAGCPPIFAQMDCVNI